MGIAVFGVGAFALGALLSEAEIQADDELEVFHRLQAPNSAGRPVVEALTKDLRYEIHHPDGAVKEVSLPNLRCYEIFDGIMKIRSTLLSNRPTLIVTSCGDEGQRAVIECISEAAQALLEATTDSPSGRPPIYIYPAENSVQRGLWNRCAKLITDVRPVYILESMVDRVCKNRRVDSGNAGRVAVDAEFYREVLAGHPDIKEPASELLQLLSSLRIEWVDDVASAKVRKIILVNGLQMCVAILAKSEGHSTLDSYFGANSSSGETLRLLSEELGLAVAHLLSVDLSTAFGWASASATRVLTSGDDVGRLLRRINDGDAGEALEAFNARVGVAVRALKDYLGEASPLIRASKLLQSEIAQAHD